jgi:hypothetical protein
MSATTVTEYKGRQIFVVSWFKCFIQFSDASEDNCVMLLLEGRASQKKQQTGLTHDIGEIFLRFPPHCTRRLQPLDVAFTKPLSTYDDSAVTTWLWTRPKCKSHSEWWILRYSLHSIWNLDNDSTANRSLQFDLYTRRLCTYVHAYIHNSCIGLGLPPGTRFLFFPQHPDRLWGPPSDWILGAGSPGVKW